LQVLAAAVEHRGRGGAAVNQWLDANRSRSSAIGESRTPSMPSYLPFRDFVAEAEAMEVGYRDELLEVLLAIATGIGRAGVCAGGLSSAKPPPPDVAGGILPGSAASTART
jgi:hypothetical protein